MKIIRILTLVFATFVTVGFVTKAIAQDNSGKEFLNKIQAQRVAFYTQKMNITPEESQKFWPVYNEYLEKKGKLASDKRKLTRFYSSNAATMTENDVDVTINKYILIDKEEALLLEEYNKKFRKILPPQKVMKLYLAETEFKTWLLGKIREKSNKLEDLPD